MSRTPTNPDFLEREASWSMPNPQDLEMHQFHLYKMFGKGADDFLHPKIEPVAKKTVNSKLRKQGGKIDNFDFFVFILSLIIDCFCRAGAQRLWNTLRKESYVRLLKEDAHVPTELKETYSAFIRESIDKDRKPIRRFFCAKEDVPELGRLQDQTALVRVRNLKHKIDLMYRASRNNQDRTEILLHNNQLPEVALSQEEPDVSRYLPSWMDDWSDSSDPDYLKWVREVQQQGGRDVTKETINEHEEEEIQDGFRENKKYEGFDDELILLMTRKKHNQAKPKYVFLTESDTRSKGRFTDKFRDEYDNKDIPKPFDGTKIPMEKAKSVLGLSTDQTFESDLPTRRSAPIPERHRRQLLEYTSRWEPLSMNALIEYKKKKEVEGEGEFNQGRPKMWTTEIKVS
ncbi:hypothetical protein FSP39_014374 [Pinctada imbricata]|uniref:Uncharacterized protein n=1 Tax=Pinctada imbricata TaxID=66713 RepID=A0AA88YD58_PINIB|nr:hypothetical protein FSP39_014374 [Pinctada imbricata]